MARARNIKPGFFKNADLAECDPLARLLFIGLWTMADREGYMEDRPKQIKMEIYPADAIDVEPLLNQLAQKGFIHRYEVDGTPYLHCLKFAKHQHPHRAEKPSEIPKPGAQPGLFDAGGGQSTGHRTYQAPDKHHANPADVLNPDIRNPESKTNPSRASAPPGPENGEKGGSTGKPPDEPEPSIEQSGQKPPTPGSGGATGEPEPPAPPPAAAPAKGSPKTARGTRLDPSWTPTYSDLQEAIALQPTWNSDHAERIAAEFRDYWIAIPGAKGLKLDWPATWRNWARRAKPMGPLTRRTHSEQQRDTLDELAGRKPAGTPPANPQPSNGKPPGNTYENGQ